MLMDVVTGVVRSRERLCAEKRGVWKAVMPDAVVVLDRDRSKVELWLAPRSRGDATVLSMSARRNRRKTTEIDMVADFELRIEIVRAGLELCRVVGKLFAFRSMIE